MERAEIARHLKEKRKIVILTFFLLLVAFLENSFLNCSLHYSSPGCELGWSYVLLAVVVAAVVYYYRK
jgi:hypothetical protein